MNDQIKAALAKQGMTVDDGGNSQQQNQNPGSPPAAAPVDPPEPPAPVSTVVDDPNANNEPPAPAAAAPPAPVEPNHSDILKGILGDEWGDLPKVKEALAKSKKDFLADIKDDEVRELVTATSKGISKAAYEQFKKIEGSGKSTPQDKLALFLQMSEGMSAEDAQVIVERQFKFGEEFNSEDPDTKLARALGQREILRAEKWLDEKKAELSTPPTLKNLKNWEPQIPSLIAANAKIEISVPGMPTPFVYAMNPAKTTEVEQFLKGIISMNDGYPDPNTDEAKAWAKGAIQNHIIATEQAQVFDNFAKWMKNEELKQKVNPSGLPEIPGSQVRTDKPMDDRDAFAAARRKQQAGIPQ